MTSRKGRGPDAGWFTRCERVPYREDTTMSDHDQPTESADPETAPRETVAFTPTPAAAPHRPPAPPPPPAPPAPPPSFRVAPPPPAAPATADAMAGPISASPVELAPDPAAEVASPTQTASVMEPATAAPPRRWCRPSAAADVAATGPRPIVAIETEDDQRGRNILISVLIVLIVAAIVATVVMVL